MTVHSAFIRIWQVALIQAVLAFPGFAGVLLPKGQTAQVVAAPKSELDRRTHSTLTTYLDKVLGQGVRTVSSVGDVEKGIPCIVLTHKGESNPLQVTVPSGHAESFALQTGKSMGRSLVVASGNTDQGLKRAVQRLILRSRQLPEGLEIPDLSLSESPWIPEREYALCPWVPQQVRGAFVNPYADNRMNIWLYGDQQLARYVEMFDFFGYGGVQLMETSYSYSVFGSPEAFQARQRILAQLAKQNGQEVSLWVWAAEFNGYGWIDPDVTYTPSPGKSAFEDPAVRRGFEKYYDHYARLAPYVDRLIGHFYDPGHLENQQDVFDYMRLLEKKFRDKNPAVKMAIDSWAAGPNYLQELADNGFSHYLLLEMSMPNLFKPGQRERLHEEARRLGLKLGIWGWYTTEYETDQLAALYVNGKVLKEFFQQIRGGVARIHPLQYWSEMEAHHLNNIASMYVAGRLLWDPDLDPDKLLEEVTEGIWGPDRGNRVLQALKLVEDTRSGPSWKTYWWTMPEHRLGSEDPVSDAERARSILQDLESFKSDRTFVPKFPLPVSPETLVELILPQLRQILAFAEFRIELDQIRARAKAGAPKSDLERLAASAWKPIPEYDTWVGTFGQIEQRMQDQLLRQLAEELKLSISDPGWLRDQEAQRLLQKLQNMQRSRRGEWQFKKDRQLNEFRWPQAKMEDRFGKLVTDGWIEQTGVETYRLTNWHHYAR
ncbi:MAG: hypothetical protein AB1898_16255 [Acidobacteriota bacterium]